MVHVRTPHAHRAAIVHHQQPAIVVAALRARPRLECRDNDEITPAAGPLGLRTQVSIAHGSDATETAAKPRLGIVQSSSANRVPNYVPNYVPNSAILTCASCTELHSNARI
jgi:hypothetical protein